MVFSLLLCGLSIDCKFRASAHTHTRIMLIIVLAKLEACNPPLPRIGTLRIAKRHSSIPYFHSDWGWSAHFHIDYQEHNQFVLGYDGFVKESIRMLTSLSAGSLHHCKRSSNRVADFLAKTVNPVVTVLKVFFPHKIQDLFLQDQSRPKHITKLSIIFQVISKLAWGFSQGWKKN